MQEGQEDASPRAELEAADAPPAAPYDAVRGNAQYQFEPEGFVRPERAPSDPWFDGPFWQLLFDVLGFILRIVFWGGLALLTAFLIYQTYRLAQRHVADRNRSRDDAGPIPAYAPAPVAVRTLLEDADALAAKGLYAEAVRLLLRRSVEDVEGRYPGTIRDSLTSREIAVLPVLAPAPREAFSGIASLVERAHFAGRTLSRDDWETARARYAVLGEEKRAGGAGRLRVQAA